MKKGETIESNNKKKKDKQLKMPTEQCKSQTKKAAKMVIIIAAVGSRSRTPLLADMGPGIWRASWMEVQQLLLNRVGGGSRLVRKTRMEMPEGCALKRVKTVHNQCEPKWMTQVSFVELWPRYNNKSLSRSLNGGEPANC